MQKKLIALAIAGLASTAAFAQTNVTVYGVADGSFDVIDIQNSTPAGSDFGTFNRVSANSSYLGFKGTEDLGNGLKAVFQFESSVSFDSTGGTTTARDSFVGLSSATMGTIVMGSLAGPTRALGGAVDVNTGATGIGTNQGLIGKLGGGLSPLGAAGNCAKSSTCASVFDTRWSNSIAYVSPTFAGFTFVGAYVADENKTQDSGVAATATVPFYTARTTGFDTGIKWQSGGWMAAATYNWFQLGDVAGLSADNIRVAGSYTGAGWSVRAMWEDTSANVEFPTIYGNTENSQQKWGIGGTYMIGKANLIGQYYQALESDNVRDDGAQQFELGVEYNLSKRTMLKTVYSIIDNDSRAKFDYGVNAAGAVGSGATINGIQMGVRHAF